MDQNFTVFGVKSEKGGQSVYGVLGIVCEKTEGAHLLKSAQ